MKLPRVIIDRINTFLQLDDLDTVLHDAARHGDVNMLEFISQNAEEILRWDYLIMKTAASHGQIGVLRRMVKQGVRLEAEWFVKAAEGGQLIVMKYLREIGCPLSSDPNLYGQERGTVGEAILKACEGRHWKCLIWMTNNDVPMPFQLEMDGRFADHCQVLDHVQMVLTRRLRYDAAIRRQCENNQLNS